MNSLQMAIELSRLVEMDIDALHSYEQAIAAVDVSNIRDHLVRFRQDHVRHIEQLSAVIRALDAVPPSPQRNFHGFLLDGFAEIGRKSGTGGALEAIRINEELINGRYHKAVHGLEFTPHIRELVGQNHNDEQMHLRHIQELVAKQRGRWIYL